MIDLRGYKKLLESLPLLLQGSNRGYNFMSLFKQLVIGGKVRNSLSMLRYKLLAIPATVKNCVDKIIVNMAIQINRRAWIRKLWEETDRIYSPSG